MSTVPYDAFLPEVLPYLRDVPEFAALNAIRSACIEFCERTTYVREVLPDIDVMAGTAIYDLEPIVGTGIVMILSAVMGYKKLEPRSLEELDKLIYGDWRSRQGPVQYITQDHYGQVRLVMIPDQNYDDPLRITAATRPLRNSLKVAKVVYEHYAEVIGFGARARLHDTPGQPYSDEMAAIKFRKWFESGYGNATIEATRGRGRAALIVRPPSI